MIRIKSFEIFEIDLPFKRPFEHSAAKRFMSNSIFLKCATDSGITGYGECLPREYVTGESREYAFDLLKCRILPRLINMEFPSFSHVKEFLTQCDGKAPAGWVEPKATQMASWCAVDIALLDTFSKAFNRQVISYYDKKHIDHVRYSAVLSLEKGFGFYKKLILLKCYGIKQVKFKVGEKPDLNPIRIIRKILGSGLDIRIDANMAWRKDVALSAMRALSSYGIHCFEQPLPVECIDESAAIIKETGLEVMADESFSDKDSLSRLIEKKACTAINVRISKCGGLTASLARCREAQDAGLGVQIGCQVGESSLLSSAQIVLLSQLSNVRYAEGCFGLLLLKEDPARPILQFGYGGRPPKIPQGPGFGVSIDEKIISRLALRSQVVC